VTRDEAARAIWCDVYGNLSEAKPGLAGALLARAEAHVMRLALIYALLDRSVCYQVRAPASGAGVVGLRRKVGDQPLRRQYGRPRSRRSVADAARRAGRPDAQPDDGTPWGVTSLPTE